MAAELKLLWTPLDAPGIDDPAIAATWAKLSIQVQGEGGARSLTEVFDRHARTERSEVYGSVLPLAEWLARCWHPLFTSMRPAPARLAPRREQFEWGRSHRWRNCGEGSALPELAFVRIDDAVLELRWRGSRGDEADEFERVLFRTHGNVTVTDAGLRASLGEFVDSVIARLDALAPKAERTQELKAYWRIAHDRRDPTYANAAFASRLGLHWWALDGEQRAKVTNLAQRRLDPIAAAGLELAGLDTVSAWTEQTSLLWQRCEQSEPALPEWDRLRQALRPRGPLLAGGREPWHRGWEACGRLRAEQGVAEDGVVDVEALLRASGAVRHDPGPVLYRSAIAWSAGRRPLVARHTGKSELPRRFASARDLYPLLFLGAGASDFGCVLSDRVAGLQPVANAFATELIAPVARVKQALGTRDRVDTVAIAEIAADIGAPDLCVQHQVENHRLAELA